MQSEDSLLLRAPKDSRNMKSAERGVSQSLHKFTFTKVMHPLLRKSSNIAFHRNVSLANTIMFLDFLLTSFTLDAASCELFIYLFFFPFVQIFGPQTPQQEVYDHTIREMVRDVLHGENRLLYTYGVTNSGKTYTIQGKSHNP